MAKRGRKSKPTAVKELAGNPGKRPLNKREPKVANEKPHMPRGVLWEDAKKFWRDNSDFLHGAGLLTKVDGAAFSLMAQSYAIAMAAAKQLEEEGLTVESSRGDDKKNPVATIFSQNASLFRQWANEFGMTPSARAGIEMPDDAEQLTLADALFQIVDRMEDSGE